jgi:exopolyphosphatase / guanosine-5'-triphosphate,3'-diphosphate pyrophosphatase
MPPILPRWEWRTFGSSFGAAEGRLAGLEPTGIQESDELYLLSAGGDNVKVRDDLMDIKVLREVDGDGLERWEPVMKAAFPIDRATAVQVLAALRLDAVAARDAYTLDEFLADFAGSGHALRAVPVHKRRVRHVINGCTAEVSEVTVDGRTTRTVAIESTDAAAVVEGVRSVGFEGFRNVSYPKGLAALLDGAPERYAVIDVGTNSVKFHVGERAEGGAWRAVADRAEITRMGEGLEETGEISPAALDRTVEAIAGMAAEAADLGALAVVAAGTAWLRIARNAGAVRDAIRARTGVHVEAVSGEDEARLAYLAAMAGLGLREGRVVVFDTGGGSTQFTFGDGPRVEERFSVDVGAVRYTERFGLGSRVEAPVLADALAAIAGDLASLDGRPAPAALAAMGGAVTNLAAVKHGLAAYDPDVVQGTVLDRAEIERQIEAYRERDVEQRRAIVGLQPKRADVILAGACIVRTVMDKLEVPSLTVSDRGLRHGLLVERFGA